MALLHQRFEPQNVGGSEYRIEYVSCGKQGTLDGFFLLRWIEEVPGTLRGVVWDKGKIES